MDDPRWYRQRYEERVGRETGNGFQKFVSAILGFHHGPEFRASGEYLADGGADGLLEHGGVVYAMYGPPTRQRPGRFMEKCRGDIEKARRNWPMMHRWVFVHNQNALGKKVEQAISALAKAHADISIEFWGRDQLWHTVARLREVDLELLFGAPPRRAKNPPRERGFVEQLEYTPAGWRLAKMARLLGMVVTRVIYMTACIALPVYFVKGLRAEYLGVLDFRWLTWLPNIAVIPWWTFVLIAFGAAFFMDSTLWRLATWISDRVRRCVGRWIVLGEPELRHTGIAYFSCGLPVAGFSVYQATSLPFLEAMAAPFVFLAMAFALGPTLLGLPASRS